MTYIISVVDTADGAVVARATTGSLKGHTFKRALRSIGVSSKGTYKHGDCEERYVVYIMANIGQKEWSLVAKELARYQAIADTLAYGIEWYIFHDLYLTEYERTQLLHADEERAMYHEYELQDNLTDEDRNMAEAISIIREGGTPVKVGFFGDMVQAVSSKYHRINKGA